MSSAATYVVVLVLTCAAVLLVPVPAVADSGWAAPEVVALPSPTSTSFSFLQLVAGASAPVAFYSTVAFGTNQPTVLNKTSSGWQGLDLPVENVPITRMDLVDLNNDGRKELVWSGTPYMSAPPSDASFSSCLDSCGCNPSLRLLGVASGDNPLDVNDPTRVETNVIQRSGCYAHVSDLDYGTFVGHRIADLNNDGLLDLVFLNSKLYYAFTTTAIAITQLPSATSIPDFGWTNDSVDGLPPHTVAVGSGTEGLTAGDIGDLNNDGLPDVLWSTSQRFLMLSLNTVTTAGAAASFRVIGPLRPELSPAQQSQVLLADIDGDGWLDIVVAQSDPQLRPTTGGAPLLYWLPNLKAADASQWGAAIVISARFGAEQVLATDVDGDGDVDLIAGGGGQVRLFRNRGGGDFGFTGSSNANGDLILGNVLYRFVALTQTDVDADGHADLVLCDGATIRTMKQLAANISSVEALATVAPASPAAALSSTTAEATVQSDVVVPLNSTMTVRLLIHNDGPQSPADFYITVATSSFAVALFDNETTPRDNSSSSPQTLQAGADTAVEFAVRLASSFKLGDGQASYPPLAVDVTMSSSAAQLITNGLGSNLQFTVDFCPDDPAKLEPGLCGCGNVDVDQDTDKDGTVNCQDGCPSDKRKTQPGLCGCGKKDSTRDRDGDGVIDCLDACPSDPNKAASEGICGCGHVDNVNADGSPNCPSSSSSSNEQAARARRLGLAIGLPVGGTLLLLCCCCVALCFAAILAGMCYMRRRAAKARYIRVAAEESVYLEDVTVLDDRKLGEGAFGAVCEGRWQGAAVALKRANGEAADALEKEAALFRSLLHPNVVQFLGLYRRPLETAGGSEATTSNEELFVVSELVDGGNLLKLAQKRQLTALQVVRLAAGVAAGMTQLEMKRMVHRDLAARNVLVATKRGGEFIPKITDFGLSAKLADDAEFVVMPGPKPIRWTAPEALTDERFSVKSDVWSFGVTIWEAMERGHMPYSQLRTNNEVAAFVLSGGRLQLSQPERWPTELRMLLLACWEADVDLRPTFGELAAWLQRIEHGIGAGTVQMGDDDDGGDDNDGSDISGGDGEEMRAAVATYEDKSGLYGTEGRGSVYSDTLRPTDTGKTLYADSLRPVDPASLPPPVLSPPKNKKGRKAAASASSVYASSLRDGDDDDASGGDGDAANGSIYSDSLRPVDPASLPPPVLSPPKNKKGRKGGAEPAATAVASTTSSSSMYASTLRDDDDERPLTTAGGGGGASSRRAPADVYSESMYG